MSTSDRLDELVEKLVKEKQIACEELTQTQLIEAFKQALKAGDFVRYVRTDTGAQQIIYAPYNECDRLMRKIDALQRGWVRLSEAVQRTQDWTGTEVEKCLREGPEVKAYYEH